MSETSTEIMLTGIEIQIILYNDLSDGKCNLGLEFRVRYEVECVLTLVRQD